MRMDISNIAFNSDGSFTVTKGDGTTVTYTNTAPVVEPTDTEVDIVLSDGSVKKFVPAQ